SRSAVLRPEARVVPVEVGGAVVEDPEALERGPAERRARDQVLRALAAAELAGVPIERDAGGVQRVDQLVQPPAGVTAACSLAYSVRAPRLAACRARAGRARRDRAAFAGGDVDADEPRIRGALLVAGDEVRRVRVVRPERDLVVDGRPLRRDDVRVQALRER